MLHLTRRCGGLRPAVCPPRRKSYAVRVALASLLLLCSSPLPLSVSSAARAQDTLTGAFQGTVTNSSTGEAVAGAGVEIINRETGQVIPKTTDTRGRFYQGLLSPGLYTIRVSAAGYVTQEVVQRLFISRAGEVVPVPVALDPAPPAGAATPTPATATTTTPTTTTPTTTTTTTAAPAPSESDTDVRARINASDARQGGSFTEEEVASLPLGSSTFTRTFDELALLLPGVAPPPQTLGSVAGPGVGAGVGTSGQFSANGLRSRGNNFTVDGSDNNDEDIGVRRQGFVNLNSQPIESVREYQAITLLAPAQFGRNAGAQVNAVSKSGGSGHHGTAYGFLNTSQLNARNPFDSAFGNESFALRAGANQPVLLDGSPLFVTNGSGGENSFTLAQFGGVIGGPVVRDRVFYFLSAEGVKLNASQEASFAVPTVDQRGFFGLGAFGLPIGLLVPGSQLTAFPTSTDGDAIFSLFPFPNNPQGAYGANTLTQTLPADARGAILSFKVDGNFKWKGRQQSVAERYNFTDDARTIPVTGSAIFSTLRPRVRTQNSSFYLNSEVSAPDSLRPAYNQLRLSYGRTRLNFGEVRDPVYQIPSDRLPNVPFLLNAPYVVNNTLPQSPTVPNLGPVLYQTVGGASTEDALGFVGQVNIAGFSPIGVDVFNFPQSRVNNTYQIADTFTWQLGDHAVAFGADVRRTELNSDLPRNSRPLITFNGAPEILIGRSGGSDGICDDDNDNGGDGGNAGDGFCATGRFFTGIDLAAAGAASGFLQTLARNDSRISLRYYQHNYFAQDTWRVRPDLSLSFGLRYEYNTTPNETSGRIERTFNSTALDEVPGLRDFIAGRTRIFESDRKNFAPRVGFAYSPNLFGANRLSVFRAGYGIFYDQIIGAVVSQSRNVYPDFLTVNFSGGGFAERRGPLRLLNPSVLVQPGTLNRLSDEFTTRDLVRAINFFVTGDEASTTNVFGATLPARNLPLPRAQHFTVSFEQQLSNNVVVSAAYVGTRGHRLLRFNTPNLGINNVLIPLDFDVDREDNPDDPFDRACQPRQGEVVTPCQPVFIGGALPPEGERPIPAAGPISRFETTASSRYDSLQLQLRGRFRRQLQYQSSYTFGKATDDVSDVFDLAGAFALPQDPRNLAAERGPANFDVRHRFTYNFIYDFPRFDSRAARLIFGGVQLAGLGSYHTGQPFTVNSIYDVNLDGNLTDRLNTTAGIVATGDRRRPYRLTVDPESLLAPVGTSGQVGRNTFRAGSVLDLNMAVSKRIRLGERQQLLLRADFFNFINRANYGIPVRFLEAGGFGTATDTVTPMRRVQFALKYSF